MAMARCRVAMRAEAMTINKYSISVESGVLYVCCIVLPIDVNQFITESFRNMVSWIGKRK